MKKSFSHQNKSNERFLNKNKTKVINLEKKPNQVLKSEYARDEVSRPGSNPMNNTTWTPSRDWHKYLSKQEPSSFTPRLGSPSPRTRSPKYSPRTLTKPQDELVALKLPTVNFSSDPETPPGEKLSTINDLCDRDKVKIAQLVEELARCKQEKLEAEDRISTLKNKVSDLKSSLNRMTDKSAEKKSFEIIKNLHLSEQTALKKQLSELNELLVRMQVQKATSDVQMKNISVQAEKMTRALHSLHKENTELQVELRVAKDKLRVAQQAVQSMTNELQIVQERINAKTEDKACQSTEDMNSNRENKKLLPVSETLQEDTKILQELFFNSVHNTTYTPKDTLIFIPMDENDPLGQSKT